MTTALRAALAAVDAISRWLVIAFMAAMIAVVSAQVLLRYGFSGSLDWAEEISRLAFVWAVFLAIPHGVRLGAHIGVDVLAKRLPAGFGLLLQRLLMLASAVLMGIVAVQAALAARDNWDQLMPTVDLSSGWFFLAVTAGCAHSACHLVARALSSRREPAPTLENAVGDAQ